MDSAPARHFEREEDLGDQIVAPRFERATDRRQRQGWRRALLSLALVGGAIESPPGIILVDQRPHRGDLPHLGLHPRGQFAEAFRSLPLALGHERLHPLQIRLALFVGRQFQIDLQMGRALRTDHPQRRGLQARAHPGFPHGQSQVRLTIRHHAHILDRFLTVQPQPASFRPELAFKTLIKRR